MRDRHLIPLHFPLRGVSLSISFLLRAGTRFSNYGETREMTQCDLINPFLSVGFVLFRVEIQRRTTMWRVFCAHDQPHCAPTNVDGFWGSKDR